MTEQIIMDGEPLEVGDRVYSLIHGDGEINDINPCVHVKRIHIRFDSGSDYYYADDLTFLSSETDRSLYWQKPEIIPPPKIKPKRKIKVWDWFVQWEFQGSTRIDKLCATTEGLVRKTYTGAECIIQKIDGTEREIR